MSDSRLRAGARRSVAAWLVLIAVLGVAVAAWCTTLVGVVGSHESITLPTPQQTISSGRVFVATVGGATSLIAQPNCVYAQSSLGTTVVLSATTGSLLSEAQASNCTN